MDNKANGYSFSELVDGICRQPLMYTMTGTFAEVLAFLTGFQEGIAYTRTDLSAEWIGFREWMCLKWQYPANHVWDIEVWRRYPDNEAALEQLRLLYLEYLAEKS